MISGGFTRGNPNPHWHVIDTIAAGPKAPTDSYTWDVLPTASLAIYVPVVIRSPVLVKKMFYGNGDVATGNYDIGIYDAVGSAVLRRGSTAKTSSFEEVVWDCTDTALSPGLYYLAVVSSNNTDTFAVLPSSAPGPTAYGVLTQSSSLPLPSSATFALTQTLAVIPHIGLLLDTKVS